MRGTSVMAAKLVGVGRRWVEARWGESGRSDEAGGGRDGCVAVGVENKTACVWDVASDWKGKVEPDVTKSSGGERLGSCDGMRCDAGVGKDCGGGT